MRSIRVTAVLALGLAGVVSSLPAQQRDSTAGQPGTGWLGVGLSCSDCSLSRTRLDNRERTRVSEWRFHGYPALTWLDSDGPAYGAGLRAGDTITAIDGHDLLTVEGGRAFGSIAPDQHIELAYRRDGRIRRARLTVGTSPEQRAFATQLAQIRVMTDSAVAASRAHQEEIRRAQRDMIRAQQEMSRLQMRMQQQRLQGLDSLRTIQSAQLDSAQRRVEEAQRTLERAMSHWGEGFGYGFGSSGTKCLAGTPGCASRNWNWTWTPPAPPATPAPPAPMITVTPNVSVAPFVWNPSGDAVRSLSSEDFASFGRLRYSGRLGANIIEARAPGPINAVEEGDSVIVITSGDMSVRVILRQPSRAPARGR